jgi:hypothetical protein
VEDFVAAGHEAAGLVLAKIQCGAKGWHTRKLPCFGSARLLISGGNDGPRIGSSLEVRERAGPGCGRCWPSSGLRRTRPGPAVARVPQPRGARRRRRV